MRPPNHYEVLGLTPSATQEEVERRYEELSRLYGSDRSQESMMALISEARRVLTSGALRAIYDSGLQSAGLPVTEEETLPTPEVIRNAQQSGVQFVPPEREITQAVPRTELEKTSIFPTPPSPAANVEVAPGGKGIAQPDEKLLARELTKRGVASDEVERLLSMGRNQPAPAKKGAKPVVSAPVIPPSEAYVPKPTITLPAARASTPDERLRAERLLTNANIARRRSQFIEAERDCRAALELVPGDSAAMELYGDILQSVGRVDDALYSYQRATELDPNRRTAERKYAELMLLQNREIEMLRVEAIPRSASLAVILSAVFPGVGQIYNGDTLKGILILVVVSACIYLLGWSPYGFHKGLTGISAPLVFFTVIGLLAYAYALVDANIGARRGKLRSGWDV